MVVFITLLEAGKVTDIKYAEIKNIKKTIYVKEALFQGPGLQDCVGNILGIGGNVRIQL
jgi:hypothetical protein